MRLERDARFALRLLARSPVFAITAVLSLAAGIASRPPRFSALPMLCCCARRGRSDQPRHSRRRHRPQQLRTGHGQHRLPALRDDEIGDAAVRGDVGAPAVAGSDEPGGRQRFRTGLRGARLGQLLRDAGHEGRPRTVLPAGGRCHGRHPSRGRVKPCVLGPPLRHARGIRWPRPSA